MENNNQDERIRGIERELGDLRLQVAGNRPIGEIVRYLLYFWTAIVVLLGTFGWKQFSDLDNTIQIKIREFLPKEEEKFAEYQKLIERTKVLYIDFQSLTAEYKQRIEDLEKAGVLRKTLTREFDLEGRILAVVAEVGNREQTHFDEESDKVTILDLEWRRQAIAVLSEFNEALTKTAYPSDFVFNVAQTCRKLHQFKLASEITSKAVKLKPSPGLKAMSLSSHIGIATAEQGEESFSKLMSMVRQLGSREPHIVLAEAWNAAEAQSRHRELVQALDDLIKTRTQDGDHSNQVIPSYVFAIKARALFRESAPGNTEKAEVALTDAIDILKGESKLAPWYSFSANEINSINFGRSTLHVIIERPFGSSEPELSIPEKEQ